jgi:hypothetical protein
LGKEKRTFLGKEKRTFLGKEKRTFLGEKKEKNTLDFLKNHEKYRIFLRN